MNKTIRQTIITTLSARQRSNYWLWQQCHGQISQSQLNDFLAGRKDITSQKLDVIFDILEIKMERPRIKETNPAAP